MRKQKEMDEGEEEKREKEGEGGRMRKRERDKKERKEEPKVYLILQGYNVWISVFCQRFVKEFHCILPILLLHIDVSHSCKGSG